MKTIKTLCFLSSFLILSLLSTAIHSQVKNDSDNSISNTNNSTKYASLAVDRSNGFYFGMATNCTTLAEAEKNAIEICKEKGGQCTVILSYSILFGNAIV